MTQRFDFHVHSWWSYDAHLDPDDLFAAAESASLSALAITDHHNMDGFASFAAAAARHPAVRWIPAMEASVLTDYRMFDVVVLGLPTDAPDRLIDVRDCYRDWMRRSNDSVLCGMAAEGLPFDRAEADALLATWRPGPAGDVQGEVRLPNHGLRDRLIEMGVIAGASEYAPFLDRISDAAGGRPPLPRAEEILPRFKELGATLILAHPGSYLGDYGKETMDTVIAQLGADGVEAGHVSHDETGYKAYCDYARSKGLLVSGGTDIHFNPDLHRIGQHHCNAEAAAGLLERLGLDSACV